MRFTVLIPARLASTRLPNKPLLEMGGLPMVVQVARRIQSGFDASQCPRICVAADHPDIVDACTQHGIEALLTRADHPSGSDRLAEACGLLGLADDEVVVNVQGDEPLIDPDLVHQVAQCLQSDPGASMGTAAHAIATPKDFLNPNVVKVVLDARQRALYFSRAPIAWWRDGYSGANGAASPMGIVRLSSPAPLRHIGIYAYRVGFLRQFPSMSQAPIEELEALEQLRALWHGHAIAVTVTPKAPEAGVDTPEDLARVRAWFNASALTR
jgi:3-deoxy-manno-octulosonate cytidylyltransferase (CMP-KDO synthetase)